MIKNEVTRGISDLIYILSTELGFSLDYLFKDEEEEHHLKTSLSQLDLEFLLNQRHEQ